MSPNLFGISPVLTLMMMDRESASFGLRATSVRPPPCYRVAPPFCQLRKMAVKEASEEVSEWVTAVGSVFVAGQWNWKWLYKISITIALFLVFVTTISCLKAFPRLQTSFSHRFRSADFESPHRSLFSEFHQRRWRRRRRLRMRCLSRFVNAMLLGPSRPRNAWHSGESLQYEDFSG